MLGGGDLDRRADAGTEWVPGCGLHGVRRVHILTPTLRSRAIHFTPELRERGDCRPAEREAQRERGAGMRDGSAGDEDVGRQVKTGCMFQSTQQRCNDRARDTQGSDASGRRRLVFNSPSGSMLPTRAQHPAYPHTTRNNYAPPRCKATKAILPLADVE